MRELLIAKGVSTIALPIGREVAAHAGMIFHQGQQILRRDSWISLLDSPDEIKAIITFIFCRRVHPLRKRTVDFTHNLKIVTITRRSEVFVFHALGVILQEPP